MNIEKLFSTRERTNVLRGVIFKTDLLSVNNIASSLGVSKGLVSKYFDILVKEGILRKTQGKFIVKESSALRGVKIFLNVTDLNSVVTR
ncbi:MAG: hypothetical protein AB1454_14460 [Candidatus Auribacterota bacterium]